MTIRWGWLLTAALLWTLGCADPPSGGGDDDMGMCGEGEGEGEGEDEC